MNHFNIRLNTVLAELNRRDFMRKTGAAGLAATSGKLPLNKLASATKLPSALTISITSNPADMVGSDKSFLESQQVLKLIKQLLPGREIRHQIKGDRFALLVQASPEEAAKLTRMTNPDRRPAGYEEEEGYINDHYFMIDKGADLFNSAKPLINLLKDWMQDTTEHFGSLPDNSEKLARKWREEQEETRQRWDKEREEAKRQDKQGKQTKHSKHQLAVGRDYPGGMHQSFEETLKRRLAKLHIK